MRIGKIFLWFLITSSLLGFTTIIKAQSALEKYYNNMGGLDSLTNLKSVKMTGKFILLTEGAAELPITIWYKMPDKLKLVTQIQGHKIIQAHDGTVAWHIMPQYGITEAEAMPEAQAEDFKEGCDLFPLIDFINKGYSLEPQQTEKMGETLADKVILTKRNGSEIVILLDKKSGNDIQISRTAKNGAKIEILRSNHKKVDGVLVPFSIETRIEGNRVSKIILDHVIVNPELADSFFKMPKTQKPDMGRITTGENLSDKNQIYELTDFTKLHEEGIPYGA